jgi:hypothetical protein
MWAAYKHMWIITVYGAPRKIRRVTFVLGHQWENSGVHTKRQVMAADCTKRQVMNFFRPLERSEEFISYLQNDKLWLLPMTRYRYRHRDDRGQPDIFGVTFGVTLGPPFELPRCYSLVRKISTKAAVFQPSHLSVADLNSSSYAEL